jgi:hypothetical protein
VLWYTDDTDWTDLHGKSFVAISTSSVTSLKEKGLNAKTQRKMILWRLTGLLQIFTAEHAENAEFYYFSRRALRSRR